MKGYNITCKEDGTLNIECSIYSIASLRKEITRLHNNAIVDMAKAQLSEDGKVVLNSIARKFGIQSSSVLAILKSNGYTKTTTL